MMESFSKLLVVLTLFLPLVLSDSVLQLDDDLNSSEELDRDARQAAPTTAAPTEEPVATTLYRWYPTPTRIWYPVTYPWMYLTTRPPRCGRRGRARTRIGKPWSRFGAGRGLRIGNAGVQRTSIVIGGQQPSQRLPFGEPNRRWGSYRRRGGYRGRRPYRRRGPNCRQKPNGNGGTGTGTGTGTATGGATGTGSGVGAGGNTGGTGGTGTGGSTDTTDTTWPI